MEKWRKAYLRKIKTKAFNLSDFNGAFRAVLEDEDATPKTIEKNIVGNQLVWHWCNIHDGGHWYSDDEQVQSQKHNYKSVANNLLKYFSPDDITDWYLETGLVEVVDGRVKLI